MDITAAGVTEVAGTHPITFKADGEIDTSGGYTPPSLTFTPNSGADPVNITINPSTLAGGGITQYAGDSSAVMKEQNGFASGTLENFSIDRTGTIMGTFTNGTSAALAQLSLADFNNPGGLTKAGDNLYQTSSNSGAAVQSFAGPDTESSITGGTLELSNVDLAQEFTNMIIAQRGFQANGRVITTSDQMLQTLVSLQQ
jgi:flagellar hook protein FlgE